MHGVCWKMITNSTVCMHACMKTVMNKFFFCTACAPARLPVDSRIQRPVNVCLFSG